MATFPMQGRARDATLVTSLTYAISTSSDNGDTYGAFGPETPINLPAQTAGSWFNWSTIVDVPVGWYRVRVRATNSDDETRDSFVRFRVVAPSDSVTGYSLESWDSPGTTAGSDSRIGYRFTVGIQDIEATALELFWHPSTDQQEQIILHRNSDGAALATVAADRVGSGGSWESYPLSSSVTLEAGETYTISTSRTNLAGRQIYIDPVNPTFSAGIDNILVVYGASGTAMPTSVFTDPEWAEDYMFVRVKFG